MSTCSIQRKRQRHDAAESAPLPRLLAAYPLEQLLEEMQRSLDVLETHAPNGSAVSTLRHWQSSLRIAVTEAGLVTDWLSVKEVAVGCNRDESTIRYRLKRAHEAGRLTRTRKNGAGWDIHRDDLDALRTD